MELSFEKIQPYLAYDSKYNLLINKYGEFIKVAKITFPRFNSQSDDYFFQLQRSYSKYLESLPKRYLIQKLDFVYPVKTYLDFHSTDPIEKIFIQNFNNSMAKKTESYIIMTLKPEEKKVNFLFNVFRNNQIKLPYYNTDILQEFETNWKGLLSLFSSSDNITVEQIKDNQLEHLLYTKYFNLEFFRKEPSLKDQIEYDSYTSIGDNLIKVFNILSDGLPKYSYSSYQEYDHNMLPLGLMTNIGYTSTILPKIVSHSINLVDSDLIEKRLKNNRNQWTWFTRQNKSSQSVVDAFDEVLEQVSLLAYQHYGIVLIGSKKNKEIFYDEIQEIKSQFIGSDIGFQKIIGII